MRYRRMNLNKLPHYYEKCFFVCSIVMLALMSSIYCLLILKKTLATAVLRFTLPLLFFRLLYHVEYRYRLLEQICRVLKQNRTLPILLPMFIGGIGAVFHHRSFLSWFLPLGFVISLWTIEMGKNITFDSRLAAHLVESILFLGLSLKLTYHSAAALTVAVVSIVLLLTIMTQASEKCEFRKTVSIMSILVLWIGALSPQILERMLFIAVTKEDYYIVTACTKLFDTAQSLGQADLDPTAFSCLLPYPPGYLVACCGWLSLLPAAAIVSILLLSGFCLSFSFLRHTSTLAMGCYILLVLRFLSFFVKGTGVIIGFEDIPFFSGNCLLDMFLAVLIMQPLRPKSLREIHPSDADYDMQEICALILLPYNRNGAEILAQYVVDTPNHVAWALLMKKYWWFYHEDERRSLLLNCADVFSTHDQLKKLHPEYYEKEETTYTMTNSGSPLSG